MSSFTLPPVTGSRIVSLGVHHAGREVPTEDIVEAIDSSVEWVVSRSGIKSRRFATDDESLIDMATSAAQRAIDEAGIDASEIGAVLLATSTYYSQTPGAAPMVAHNLGITAGAWDVSAGCAGFCYGLGQASDMVRVGTAKYVLVIGAERLSESMDMNDRGTAFIFGDGAGAVIVGPSDEHEIGPVTWGSDGSQSHVIRQEPQMWTSLRDNPEATFPVVTMEGQKVFRWAAFKMAPVAQQILASTGISATDLDAFIPHQANLRIVELLAKQIGIPENVAIAHDIEESGNTSAASVPLAMHAMLRNGEAKAGDTALLMAFGAGLVYAGQVVKLPALKG